MTLLEGGRERRVRTGGIELCVVELGDPRRPTVVLVHGYPDSKEVWSEVASRLADRFHVVLYDVRGHGRSEAPKPLRGGFTLEKLTDDFLAVADAVSPDGPVHLVGHDWGSVQAWEFVTVRRTEGRVRSFTSLSGPSLDHFGHWIASRVNRPTPRRVGQLLGQGAKSWYVYLLHTPALPELAWRGPLGKRWPGILRRVEKVPADAYPTPSLPSDAANGAWLYRDNVRPRLRRPRADAHAHVPVQLITPLGDRFLSERLYDELDDWAPRLTRRTLPAGHWIPRTRPDRLASWIDDFVTSVETEGKGSGGGSAPGTPHDAVRTTAGDAGALEAVGPGGGIGRKRSNGRNGKKERNGGRPGRRRAAELYAERLAGQLVLVTGAGSGIGRATALAFAETGARVIAVDRDADSAARTAELSRRVGAPDAWAEAVDVSDERAMEKLAAKVHADHGVLDVLVNNAGIGLSGSFFDTTSDDWRRVLDVNLWGVIHGCRLLGRPMAERGQGGHIVNVASAAAFLPSRALPAYSTSKAAVLMLSECLRAELADRDIGVTAICPGLVNTAITSTATFVGVDAEEERRRQKRAARLYGIRNYPPEKVARAILRAVVHDEAMVAVAPEAKTAHALSRFFPGLLRALARVGPPL
ncbi:SDR family oxidoreductase [Streptomyces sp. NPDC001027]|uniref:SDR family oxidoreductase n=1 Tax=Streptomyces sp. NPDC001027 TaxID=3154771 RepID=UPI00331E2049